MAESASKFHALHPVESEEDLAQLEKKWRHSIDEGWLCKGKLVEFPHVPHLHFEGFIMFRCIYCGQLVILAEVPCEALGEA